MLWVFFISVLLLGYTYAGYPVLIALMARIWGRPVKKGPVKEGVSILITAHNEVEALPRKVEALLDLAQDEPILEICLGLDGCTDGTGDRLRERIGERLGSRDPGLETEDTGIEREEYPASNIQHSISKGGEPGPESQLYSFKSAPKIQILEFEAQRGKAAVLNDLMKKATASVWVMMDARQRVEPGAISCLLENFADPKVGVVSGALVYEAVKGGVQKGAASYWGYEKNLRLCESRFWAVPGATGALYAIRRDCCHSIPENTLVDDVLIPMRAVLAGYRCLFEPSAKVFDLPTTHFDQEGLRKRRTLAGIWQCFHIEPKIYLPFSNPIWFQWISHKFLRLLTPFFVLLALFSLGFLAWGGSLVWKILFWGSFLGIFSSFLAYLMGKHVSSRVLGVSGAFWGVNLALLQAAWDACMGRFETKWKQV